MILTNLEIITLTEGLISLKQNNSNVLPIKVGFNIIKNIKLLTPIYESIIEMRNNIVQKHAVDGYLNEKDIEVTNAEILELGNIKNEIELNMVSLKDIEELKISLSLLDDISNIILEDI